MEAVKEKQASEVERLNSLIIEKVNQHLAEDLKCFAEGYIKHLAKEKVEA